MSHQDPLLEARNVVKEFPGVQALRSVDLQLLPGEIHMLLGENGAGKSTLIKILSGVYPPDSGELLLAGRSTHITSPRRARELGLFTIHQEFCLLPLFTVAQNINLGSEPSRHGFIDKTREHDAARAILDRLGFDVDPSARVCDLNVAQKQMVEIVKALQGNGRVIMLDEPTAALTGQERDKLFDILRQLRDHGVGILYISHRLEEVKMIGDRVTVLRDGAKVETFEVTETTETAHFVRLMTGKDMGSHFPSISRKDGQTLLEVAGLSDAKNFTDVSIQGRAGEIVGLFGLAGCGSIELGKAVAGASAHACGSVRVNGAAKPIRPGDPAAALDAGISYIPADRKTEGLLLDMSVQHNITLASLPGFLKGPFIRQDQERDTAASLVESLQIKSPSIDSRTRTLSGGNQQKILIAKALCRGAKVFVFCEPTRGIDIGAKMEIYKLLGRLVDSGCFVLMISSELPEILSISHRVMVMHKGRIVREFAAEEATEEKVLRCAFGG